MQLRSLTDKQWILLFSFLALFTAFELYGPSLQAPYIFDDGALPFAAPRLQTAPLATWISGNRPVLMLSYWLNSENDFSVTGAFHRTNVFIHVINSILVFLIIRRFLPANRWLPALLAGIFLVHPLQTESVAYIAGRSESLCALFSLAAFAIFLIRPEGPITWTRSAATLAFYAAAVLTKENAVILPALFLLTDLFQSPQSVRQNWRLYAPVTVLGAAGILMVVRVLAGARTAGFNSNIASWDHYALTQTRAVFHYIRLAVLPIGQSIDHDFQISQSLADHHTWLFLTLLLLLITAAVLLRHRFPLAAFGFFLFLILLAPTSSFVPIADPFVERRMYLPMLGLLLIAADALRRIQFSPPLAVAALAALSFLTYQRNIVLSQPLVLWIDTVKSGTQNGRPYSFLADAAVKAGACNDVAPFMDDALRRLPNHFQVLLGAATVLECLNKPADAVRLLRQAVRIRPSSAEAHELLGLLYGEMGEMDAARESLQTAARLNPDSANVHLSLGIWYQAANDFPKAAAAFRRVLQYEPNNAVARDALRKVETILASR
ncbi:MAG: tetratricopeptide repeat protein [Acidobacteria bacterium]|nr:tetratricopeptide repeat protein [Acidobacteriota bacterium]